MTFNKKTYVLQKITIYILFRFNTACKLTNENSTAAFPEQNIHWLGKPKPVVTGGETAIHMPQTTETVPTKAPIMFYWKTWLIQLYLAMLKGKKNSLHIHIPTQIHWFSAVEGLCRTKFAVSYRVLDMVVSAQGNYYRCKLFSSLTWKKLISSPVCGYHRGNLGG